jgi:hypothetical protein
MIATHFARGSLLFVALLASASASAQVRTFVASTGVDSNPCSRIAPCRTFQAAVDAAAAGGEVIALDSAGFGSNVSITKPISIIGAPGVYAGITVFSAKVAVSNSIASGNGSGFIAFANTVAAELSLETCVAFNNDVGVRVAIVSTGTAVVRLSNSTVPDNQTGLLNDGLPAALLSRGNNTVEGNVNNTSGVIGSYSAK